MNVKNKTLGEKVLYKIEENSYLADLYKKLLLAYSHFLFRNDQNFLKSKEYMDLLRFADLMSNSQNLKQAELHRNLAHKIIAMLTIIYPKSHIMLLYKNRILENLNNYYQTRKDNEFGTKMSADYFINTLVNDYKTEKLRIPGTEKVFIGKQKALYDQLENALSSVSAPTSMGKTFLMLQFIASKLTSSHENNNFALVVPSRALITEITDKLLNELEMNSVKTPYRIINSMENTVGINNNESLIFVVTPERLFYLLTDCPDIRLDYLFIDESQKISEKGPRSTFYYQVFDIIDNWDVQPKITFAAPVVPNPEEYLRICESSKVGKHLAVHQSAVSQINFVVDTHLGKVGVFDDLENKLIDLSFMCLNTNTQIDVLEYIVDSLDSKMKNLVYPNSIKNTMNLSMRYANDLKDVNDDNLEQLSKYIANKLNPNYYLVSLVKKGIAFHIGRLPSKIRRKIESEFKDGSIRTLFCTSTLMEGINLPADNVFVFNLKNGNHNMSDVDFRNLIGRAGRLNHSMIGNSFLVTNPMPSKKPQIDDYLELLTHPIQGQRLSIDELISKQKLEQINHDLQLGNIDLRNVKSHSVAEYAALRKFTLIYLNDIDKDRHSIVRKKFASIINDQDERRINAVIHAKYEVGIENDINFSSDQANQLISELQKDNLYYPQPIVHGEWNFKGALELLYNMADIFNWKTYEKRNLGKVDKSTGELLNIYDYAILLIYWISGENLSTIIAKFLEIKEQDRLFLERVHSNWDGTLNSINDFINRILDQINQIISFKLKNYFMKISKEMCRTNNVKVIDNDWYRYITYGTVNELRIWLQKHGYSRESTKYISEHEDMFVIRGAGGYLLSPQLEEVDDQDVVQETKKIRLFMPNIFTDFRV